MLRLPNIVCQSCGHIGRAGGRFHPRSLRAVVFTIALGFVFWPLWLLTTFALLWLLLEGQVPACRRCGSDWIRPPRSCASVRLASR